jgi:hypothetical protein
VNSAATQYLIDPSLYVVYALDIELKYHIMLFLTNIIDLEAMNAVCPGQLSPAVTQV